MIFILVNQQNLAGGYTEWVHGIYPLDSWQGSKHQESLHTAERIAYTQQKEPKKGAELSYMNEQKITV